jgi:hypothetical protein
MTSPASYAVPSADFITAPNTPITAPHTLITAPNTPITAPNTPANFNLHSLLQGMSAEEFMSRFVQVCQEKNVDINSIFN